MAQDRIPPQNIEAEMSLLGSLMLDKEAIIKVADFLQAEDFYQGTHQTIYEAMQELFEKGEPIDLLSVSGRLKEKEKLEAIGGRAYLTQLINSVATASHVQSYAKTVQKKRLLRDLISASYDISKFGYDESEDPEVLLDRAEGRIFTIAQRSISRNFIRIKEDLEDTFERIERLSSNQGMTRGVPTGFKDLDNMLSGFQKSDLVILAARPSHGKCVAGDTEVVDPETGAIHTIDNLVEEKTRESVLGLNDQNRLQPLSIGGFWNNGIQKTYLLHTALGKEIKVTKTHPFLTIEGWKPLEELKTGERIAVPRVLPVFGKKTIPVHEVKALAYFASEGGLTNGCPIFTTGNKQIGRDFLEALSCFPNVKAGVYQKKGTHAVDYRVSEKKYPKKRARRLQDWGDQLKAFVRSSGYTQKQLAAEAGCVYQTVSYTLNGHSLPTPEIWKRISDALAKRNSKRVSLLGKFNQEYLELSPRNSVTEFLKESGMWGKLAIEKSLPQSVFTLPQKELSLFLNRLFICDGSFWQSRNGEYHLSYCSSSKKMAQQVQHLLLRFGIFAGLRGKQVKYNGKRYQTYEIEAQSAENLLRFIDLIGMYGKEDKLAAVRKKLVGKKKGWTNDTIPMGVWEEILSAKGEESWRSVYQRMGRPLSFNIHAFRREPRRETVALLGSTLDAPQLNLIAESDVYWDRVVRIEEAEEARVYDLTVPQAHNFIANDIIIHNSAMAMDIARRVATIQKIPVGVFSLEMSRDQLVDRMLASQGGIDLWKLRTGKLSSHGDDNDYARIQQAMDELSQAPIFIEDSSAQNVLQMRAMTRRLQANHGIGLLIIDYLQLIEPRNSQASEVQQVTEISRSLKNLARELDIPVLALSQLSRAVEQRTPPRPRLSDLRQSGSIEQDSDVVLFIYREDKHRATPENQNIAEVIVAKHRNGPVGSVKLYFDEPTASFSDLAKDRGFAPGEAPESIPF